ncbi:MAG: AAA family ATPase, partial [Clostridia bacterium]|nr:AAA family ATPase [Clostridia bacterium]
MLSELYIKNIATVRELCVAFDRPFNVMTGNTGAGKSVIIGCIKCICGEKPSHSIRTGEDLFWPLIFPAGRWNSCCGMRTERARSQAGR